VHSGVIWSVGGGKWSSSHTLHLLRRKCGGGVKSLLKRKLKKSVVEPMGKTYFLQDVPLIEVGKKVPKIWELGEGRDRFRSGCHGRALAP